MNNSNFFCNKNCDYYPCHNMNEDLNCLFCYCPLYHLKNCGGDYTYTANNIKDCSNCTLPHKKDSYEIIIKKVQSFDL